ncbi:MAG: DUF3192 domain-containing protein [Bacteroidota bacterium]|nr:DUF3192 domain-containing protein [Bacteroidota bacterium]
MLKKFTLLFLYTLLISCENKVAIEGFDGQNWKDDKLGCQGKRDQLAPIILEQRDKILGLSESEILNLMGRADFLELSKRNQKFYFYYFLPGPQCEKTLSGEKNQTLQIRFNSVGYANEIMINRN